VSKNQQEIKAKQNEQHASHKNHTGTIRFHTNTFRLRNKYERFLQDKRKAASEGYEENLDKLKTRVGNFRAGFISGL
jgi:hypothetical protein